MFIDYVKKIYHPFIFILIFISFLFELNSFAAFENVATGARQAGMANSFTAIADDSNTIFYNPAGLTNIERIEFTVIHAQLYQNLSDDLRLADQSFSFAFPINKNNGTGISWYSRSLAGLYSENTFIAGYSYNFWDILKTGINFKMRQKKYIPNEWTNINTIFKQGNQASNYTFDLGILYNLDNNSIGLSLMDITEPDMGIWEKSKIPVSLNIGYKHTFTSNLEANIDTTYQDRSYHINTGVENCSNYSFGDVFWRAGLGIGNDKYRLLALGIGYQFNQNPMFQIDYAFNYPLSGIKKTTGTHLVSLNTKFGQNRQLTEEEQKKESKTTKDFITAQNYYNNGKYISAHDLFDDILAMQPKSKRIEKLSRKYIELIVNKIKQMNEPPQSYYAHGFISYTKGEFQDAVKKWEKLTILNPQFDEIQIYLKKAKKNADELFKMGKKLFDKELYSESILYFKAAYKWNADETTNIYIQRAKIKIDLNKNKSHLKKMSESMKKIPESITQKVDYTDEESLKKITQLVDEGIMDYRVENYAKALEKFSEALKMDPNNYKIVLYMERTKNKIKLDSNYINTEQEDKLYREAMDKYLKGNLKESIKLWEEILTINPNNKKALNNLLRAQKELETQENKK